MCTNAGAGICSACMYGRPTALRRNPLQRRASGDFTIPPEEERMLAALSPYPSWLNAGDNAWQLTAATFVGLMSVPGLVVLYGGVMQKRWSVNSMMLTFLAFGLVLVAWTLWAFDMGFGHPIGNGTGLFSTFVG